MRKTLSVVFCGFLLAVSCLAQGNQFKVRYNGGTITTKVKHVDWGNLITVSSSVILLNLKDGQQVTIDPKKVAGLSYGKNASRNIKGYAAAAILVNPLFLFGMLKKNKQHFVGITYDNEAGEHAGVLLQAKNNQYRSLLETLKAVTGKPVDSDEKEKPKEKP
jgi:hypothetical protein